MGQATEISWTDHTFSPWWGCTKVSPACDHCYADTFSRRVGFSDTGSKFPIWGKDAQRRFFSDKHWGELLKWNRDAQRAGVRRNVFCGSMCDVMEDRADLVASREKLYSYVPQTPWLNYLLVTKRPQNFRRFLPAEWRKHPQPNIWLMTTVESGEYLWRIDALKEVPAVVHGLSIEPLLADIPELAKHLDDIEWCIVGGESGPGARPMHPDWVRRIRDACQERGIAFHMKQWGAWAPASQVGAPKPITHAMTAGAVVAEFDRESMMAADRNETRWEGLRRLGKGKSGCLLDEREWKQIPNPIVAA